jgi:pimeloyl-ACP methyl ester carboxylesterase
MATPRTHEPEPGRKPGGVESDPAMAGDRKDYPFASRFAEIPAGRIHYIDEGEGETLLFIHGTPTWSFDWRRLVAAFSGGYRCVAPDHLGFGYSDRPKDFDYTPESHARNLEAFVRKLGLRDITLIVHDFGGPIGLPLPLNHPGLVKRVVLINTWMWSFAGDKAMERSGRIAGGARGKFLYRRANFSLRVLRPYAYGDRKKLTASVHKRYLDRFPDAWSRERVLWTLARCLLASGPFYDSLWERRDALRNLPVLLLWGMKDRAFPPSLLRRWKEALPGARTVEIPSAGHWPHEEEPEKVEAALREFLEPE